MSSRGWWLTPSSQGELGKLRGAAKGGASSRWREATVKQETVLSATDTPIGGSCRIARERREYHLPAGTKASVFLPEVVERDPLHKGGKSDVRWLVSDVKHEKDTGQLTVDKDGKVSFRRY